MESNYRPLTYQVSALTTELHAPKMPTLKLALSGKRSTSELPAQNEPILTQKSRKKHAGFSLLTTKI